MYKAADKQLISSSSYYKRKLLNSALCARISHFLSKKKQHSTKKKKRHGSECSGLIITKKCLMYLFKPQAIKYHCSRIHCKHIDYRF